MTPRERRANNARIRQEGFDEGYVVGLRRGCLNSDRVWMPVVRELLGLIRE